jgi:Tfp pilus assembly protein PilX
MNVTALQARLTAARRDRDRALGAYESAVQVADAARADLEREFGVSTIEEAESMVAHLQDTLDEQMEHLAAVLDQIGA